MKVSRPAGSHTGPRDRRSTWIGNRQALDTRAARRKGSGFCRCIFPRAHAAAEILGRYEPCGALVFEGKRARHLAEVHGVGKLDAASIELAFVHVPHSHPDE